MESDRDGLAMADAAGYAAGGCANSSSGSPSATNQTFGGESGPLPRRTPRNEGASRDARQGNQGAGSTRHLVLGDRYKANISLYGRRSPRFATVESGSAGLAGGTTKPAEEPKKKGFGLSTLISPAAQREVG